MAADVEYHLQRARSEREIAYSSADDYASEAHLKLSALHLEQAKLLQEVRRAPVGNVTPFQSNCSLETARSTSPVPLIELASSEVVRRQR
jgi:hypothetical protein